MSGFDAGWLALREPFDRAARSADLAGRFAAALGAVDRPRIVDLGCGTGANLRVLAPLIARDQHWELVDWDPALLNGALDVVAHWAEGIGGRVERLSSEALVLLVSTGRWTVSVRRHDLSSDLEGYPFHQFDAVVTTAFLDLVSEPWIARFAEQLAAAPRPFLATLTVDGRREWAPLLDDDALIQTAFMTHQGGDKGFGDSLGALAAAATVRALTNRGFRVEQRGSDWRIDSRSGGAMLGYLLDEAARVAAEVRFDARADILAWHQARQAQIEQGRLSYTVGHQDLLALP
jgi:SAM-dependent methyltransferase